MQWSKNKNESQGWPKTEKYAAQTKRNTGV